MARYWVYMNDEVLGPFAVEQLIRVRGFSRQTLVCIDDHTGKPGAWISPAEIPELAHIFKAAVDHMAAPSAPAQVRGPAKPAAPKVTMHTAPPQVAPKPAPRKQSRVWIFWLLTAAAIGAGVWSWFKGAQRDAVSAEKVAAKTLVETYHLPDKSLFGSLQQYIQEKQLTVKWDIERAQEAMYKVTMSWYSPSLSVYAFEANVQAQTVRGLNTAAIQLLTEGFPAPAKPKVEAPKKPPSEMFPPFAESRREAVEGGDFETVWNLFSRRKKAEMSKGGISRDGFLRVQSLTHRLDSGLKQTILKTKSESETEMLALVKQSQPKKPELFIKQLWVYEDGAWKLDDEETRSGEPVAAPVPSSPAPNPAPAASSAANDQKPNPSALPGMSQ